MATALDEDLLIGTLPSKSWKEGHEEGPELRASPTFRLSGILNPKHSCGGCGGFRNSGLGLRVQGLGFGVPEARLAHVLDVITDHAGHHTQQRLGHFGFRV